ncbi:N-6 DNA methylase [Ensifer adhaerens]|uniref:N-6 DNA methylase n=1 Tax=Ensifer adhaerens TaxID=106592 RepID=UPI003D04D7FF
MTDTTSNPADFAFRLADAVERHHSLEGGPFSDILLSHLTQVEPAVVSGWLNLATGDWPLSGFQEWFTSRLDEVGFIGNHDTPSSVSRLVASLFVVGSWSRIFDPACGTGGLLQAAAETYGEEVSLYGQEISSEALAWANLRFLVCDLRNVRLTAGPAFADQHFGWQDYDRKFDIVLNNPPFGMPLDPHSVSLLARRSGNLIGNPVNRLPSETAFVQEAFSSIASSGAAAVIVPNGLLFRGGVDRRLREGLVGEDAVRAVIGLPARMFAPGTTIETAILVLSRNKSQHEREHVLFIDARGLGKREGPRVVLGDEAAQKIQRAINEWRTEGGFSQVVPLEKLDRDAFSLSPAYYVKAMSPIEAISPLDRRSRIRELDERYVALQQEYEVLQAQLARPE